MEITASSTSESVELSWTPPAYDGGLAVTGYEIWWDQGVSTWFCLNTNYTGGITITLTTGLSANTTY
jgi:hypothetical protein